MEGIKQLSAVNRIAGHDVEILSLDGPDDPWVRDCPLKVHAVGPGLTGYGYSGGFKPWLLKHRREYDAVVVNGLWQYCSFGVWRALRGTDTPYFVYPHGMLDPWFKRAYPLKHLKKWLYWPWAEYRVLRDARAVFFTCEEERRMARKSFWLYRCNEVVVNYGTAGPAGDEAAQRQVVLDRFPDLRGKRVFLFLGRIHEKKGCDLLIKAFAKVANHQSPVTSHQSPEAPIHLVIAGPCASPQYLEQMRKLASELCPPGSVSFPGMVTGDAKWGMLRVAEAFVLPSHQENFGIAVAEAMACGTPVLISNKVNIWREIEQDGAGLVDDDDEPGTVRLLQKWLELPEENRKAMDEKARASFQSRFEVNRAANSLIAAIT
jgi:glycosyltransferase involved in cell wall biosynthesis